MGVTLGSDASSDGRINVIVCATVGANFLIIPLTKGICVGNVGVVLEYADYGVGHPINHYYSFCLQ